MTDATAHREGLTDLDHLVPVWCQIPEHLAAEVTVRASELGLTVDQWVALALVATLPGIIAESLARNLDRDGNAAIWPGPRIARDDLGRPVPPVSQEGSSADVTGTVHLRDTS